MRSCAPADFCKQFINFLHVNYCAYSLNKFMSLRISLYTAYSYVYSIRRIIDKMQLLSPAGSIGTHYCPVLTSHFYFSCNGRIILA